MSSPYFTVHKDGTEALLKTKAATQKPKEILIKRNCSLYALHCASTNNNPQSATHSSPRFSHRRRTQRWVGACTKVHFTVPFTRSFSSRVVRGRVVRVPSVLSWALTFSLTKHMQLRKQCFCYLKIIIVELFVPVLLLYFLYLYFSLISYKIRANSFTFEIVWY